MMVHNGNVKNTKDVYSHTLHLPSQQKQQHAHPYPSPQVWDLGPGSEGRLSPLAQTLPGGHSDYVLSVCFSQDGKYIISGSKDRSVTIWDAKLMKRVSSL